MSNALTILRRLRPRIEINSSRALALYIVHGSVRVTALGVALDIAFRRWTEGHFDARSAGLAMAICLIVSPVFFFLHGLSNRELYRVRKQLEVLSRTDLQTGLLNRRAFCEVFELLGSRDAKTFLIADIDHFKRINDRYGHPAGDVVITAIASTIAEVLPQRSIVARLGGEEYAALLDLDADAAKTAADALCRAVRERGAQVDGIGRIAVTISIGVAQLSDTPNFAAVYQAADRALYDAKAAGRDRAVAAWDRDTPAPIKRRVA